VLPGREVGVLDVAGRQPGVPALDGGCIELPELLEKEHERPAVVDEVVLHVHEYVAVGRQADEPPGHQRKTIDLDPLLEFGVR
jgi:hypothetical protein